MSLLEGIFKPISGLLGLLNSPLATIIILSVGVFIVGGFYLMSVLQPQKYVLYCQESEHQGDRLLVNRQTPKHLHTKKKKDPYRFIRFRDPFTFQFGWKTVTYYFGKMGTAFTKGLETGEVGDFTLWDIMNNVWGESVCEALVDDQKQALIESQVKITVKLEEGYTPEGYKAKNELAIQEEADAEHARIFGIELKSQLTKEDWIRTAGIFGAGIGAALILQSIGIIGGMAA